jgi:hypothetical protein
MTDCATSGMRFGTQSALEAAFDGGRLTSDGGLVWLAEADSELGLCERVVEQVPESSPTASHTGYPMRKRLRIVSSSTIVSPRMLARKA